MRHAIVWALLGLYDLCLSASEGLERAAMCSIGAASWVAYLGHAEPESDDPPWRDR